MSLFSWWNFLTTSHTPTDTRAANSSNTSTAMLTPTAIPTLFPLSLLGCPGVGWGMSLVEWGMPPEQQYGRGSSSIPGWSQLASFPMADSRYAFQSMGHLFSISLHSAAQRGVGMEISPDTAWEWKKRELQIYVLNSAWHSSVAASNDCPISSCSFSLNVYSFCRFSPCSRSTSSRRCGKNTYSTSEILQIADKPLYFSNTPYLKKFRNSLHNYNQTIGSYFIIVSIGSDGRSSRDSQLSIGSGMSTCSY